MKLNSLQITIRLIEVSVMSIKVLLKEYPYRSIVLITSSHALVFHHSPSSNPDNSSVTGYPTHSDASLVDKYGGAPRIMVEFSSLSAIDLHDYKPFAHPCKGTLGLITLGRDVFICLVNSSSHVATLRPGERVERIHTVEFRKAKSVPYVQSSLPNSTFQIV